MITADTIVVMSHSPAGMAELFRGRLEGDGDRRRSLGDIVSDSRRIVPGSAFIALRGEHEDGHDHVADAVARGATLAIVAESWAAPGPRPPLLLRVPDTAAALREACTRRLAELGCTVIGITGSVGKTTVKEMTAHVLDGSRRVGRTEGNLNTWTGVPLSVLRVEGPIDIFVAEMAMSAGGEIRDLASFSRPRIGVLLNIGLAHVGMVGSVDAIAEAKAELLEALPSDGVAVLNADDPRVASLASRSRAPAVWFGTGDADFCAQDIQSDGFAGTRFTLRGPHGAARVHLTMPGPHAVLDACATAAVAAQVGLGVEATAERLAGFTVPEKRGRVTRGATGALIYDDSYNSSPSSLAAALVVLEGSGVSQRIAVLGDMLELGDLAGAEHERAGRHAAAVATHLIAVGEYATTISDAAMRAGMAPGHVYVAADAAEAAHIARELLQPGTTSGKGRGPNAAVLVKGSRGIGLERVVERLAR